MTELFEIPECKSPRLLWLEKQGLLTHKHPMPDVDGDPPWMCIRPIEKDKGKEIWECMADHARIYEENNLIGYGTTENAAILDWAVNTKTPLWNEE